MTCNADLNCPAEQHTGECPWAPGNVQWLKLNSDEFDAMLDALERPARRVPRLTRLMEEGDPWG